MPAVVAAAAAAATVVGIEDNLSGAMVVTVLKQHP